MGFHFFMSLFVIYTCISIWVLWFLMVFSPLVMWIHVVLTQLWSGSCLVFGVLIDFGSVGCNFGVLHWQWGLLGFSCFCCLDVFLFFIFVCVFSCSCNLGGRDYLEFEMNSAGLCFGLDLGFCCASALLFCLLLGHKLCCFLYFPYVDQHYHISFLPSI